MVSILEQYEIETGRSSEINNLNDINNQFNLAYVQNALTSNDETTQIFDKQFFKLDFKMPIKQVIMCNDILMVLVDQKMIHRINMLSETKDVIEAPDRVSKMYLDPSGRHFLLATESQELYYYLKTSKKFRQINKLKGYLVTSVGWNSNSTEITTDSILIGTNKGVIFEMCINVSDENRFFSQSVDNYCRLAYTMTQETPIHGIEIIHKSIEYTQDEIYDIFVATSKRLYEFIGVYSKTSVETTFKLSSILSMYEKHHDKIANFNQLPIAGLTYSRLVLIPTKNRGSKLAWMTGSSVLINEINYNLLTTYYDTFSSSFNLTADVKRLISESNSEIIQYPQDKDRSKDSSDYDLVPLSIALTEHHLLIMFEKAIKGVCILSKEVILNEKFNTSSGRLLAFWQNTIRNEIGFYTDKSIVKYKITKETRNLWKYHLKNNDYNLAKEFCKDNPIQLNEVLTKQADSLFNKKRYSESAEVYASTEISFEEVCLKFLDVQDMTALRMFLVKKFLTLKSPSEITQITLIVSWIIEIYLNQLGDLNEQKNYDEYYAIHKEFHKFLDNTKIKECLYESKDAIYEIFTGHGNLDDLIYFAELMKDYEKILSYYIQHENYIKALNSLAKQNKAEFYYKYSPILMQHVPKELIDLWMQLGIKLDANKLLPSLTIGRQTIEQANESIRYLEYCINKLDIKDTAIHNYLISLYIKYKPDELLNYIKRQGDDESLINYDKYYALRLCLNNENNSIKEACVYIYKIIGLYEEAVNLALSINVDLAKEIADSSDVNSNDELKQKLWLFIARHVIEEKKDVTKAMSFLEECGDMIQIEDILPYFPDFVTIDDFKVAIKDSLASYTRRIDTLKDDIEQAAQSAESIRNDIQLIRGKSVSISSSERCLICHFPLLTRSFYVFPCAHKFHSDCLYQEILPHLLPAKRKKIDELQKLLHDVTNSNFGPTPGTATTATSSLPSSNPLNPVTNIVGTVAEALNQKLMNTLSLASSSASKSKVVVSHVTGNTYSNQEIEHFKSELDDLLASECIYCGESLIKTIDEPFYSVKEYDEVFKSWL